MTLQFHVTSQSKEEIYYQNFLKMVNDLIFLLTSQNSISSSTGIKMKKKNIA